MQQTGQWSSGASQITQIRSLSSQITGQPFTLAMYESSRLAAEVMQDFCAIQKVTAASGDSGSVP